MSRRIQCDDAIACVDQTADQQRKLGWSPSQPCISSTVEPRRGLRSAAAVELLTNDCILTR
jgi:hypothetical protein